MGVILFKELSYNIYKLLFKAHNDLGRYRNERQYADYFEKLLCQEKIKYIREYSYIDQKFGNNQVRCKIDFIIEDKIIIEFKAKSFIAKEDYYQTKRYLTTLNLELAILVNFRQYRLAPKRILNSDYIRNGNSD